MQEDQSEYLWPARNVAEHAYCKRLFYLMEVEGVQLPNVHTEQGKADHKKADKPSRSRRKHWTELATPDPDRHELLVRSLELSSDSLKLFAKLDLAEIDGDYAVPIEYRKGRSRQPSAATDHTQPSGIDLVWEVDAVQLGLQSLLLKESGYTVDTAKVFYATDRTTVVLPIDSSITEYALRVFQQAQITAQGSRPEPLVDDPRCVGCSLQPLCLPDEVNAEKSKVSDLPNRGVLPELDGMHDLVVQTQRARVGVKGRALKVSTDPEEQATTVPIAGLSSVTVFGNASVSTQAMHLLSKHSVPIVFATLAGKTVSIVEPNDSTSAVVRIAQATKLTEPGSRLKLARELVAAKVENQRTVLMRNCSELPQPVKRELKSLTKRALAATGTETLMGLEGRAAAVYFEHLPSAVTSTYRAAFAKHGRKRRPPPDPVNACLSLGYSVLTNECATALRAARLDPAIGALHSYRPGRPALALDLIEPFRPLIVDSVMLSLLNRGELRQGHFIYGAGGCSLTSHGRSAFFANYGKRLATTVTHPYYGYKLSYRRMVTLHARLIAAWLVGDVQTVNFLRTR